MVPSFSSVSSWSTRSLLLLVVALAACTEPVVRTQVTVVIDADESVRRLIRYVDVEVRSGSPDADLWDVQRTKQLIPRDGDKSWPLRFSLARPEGSGRIGYLVIATAKGADDSTLTVVRALSDYVEGKSVELRLKFDEACMMRMEQCATTFSCRQGECIDPYMPGSQLPTTTGSDQTSPGQMNDSPAAGTRSEPEPGSVVMQGAGGMGGAAPGCQGSACPPAMCAARAPNGACLPCPAGFTGDDAKSCSPTLISLAASAGTLAPTFDPKTTAYTLDVGLLSERVTITLETPATTEALVDGHSLDGKTTWTTPALAFGETEVVITLNAAPGSSHRTYTLKLNRSGAEQQLLTAPYPGAGDAFGSTVAISGDLLVVGAPYEDGSESTPAGEPNEAMKDSGAAYVYERTPTGWQPRGYLKAEMPREAALFGFRVAIDGKRIVVGAPHDADGGSVYVYEYGASGPKRTAILHGDGLDAASQFGRAVALQGDKLVVGCPSDDVGATQTGSVYAFDYDGSAWQPAGVMRSEAPGPYDWLGSSVALDGDLVVSGATGGTAVGEKFSGGLTYVFARTAEGWKQRSMVNATPGVDTAFFGESLSILGTAVAVGGFPCTPLTNVGGTAYLFTPGGDGRWKQDDAIQPKNTRTGDCFAERVWMLNPDLLLIGASHESSAMPGIGADGTGTLSYSGAVYLFSRSSGSWRQSLEIKPSEPMATQEFGAGLAVSNGTFIVGSPSDPNRNGSSMKPGGVYVFR
jgi:hypothetical protein